MNHSAHGSPAGRIHSGHGPGHQAPAFDVGGERDPAASHSRRVSHSVAESGAPSQNSVRLAFSATLHCLTGCAIGEVLGMVIGTALGFSNLATIALAVGLAFVFGYLLTMLPLLRSGMPRRAAIRLALAADTASITLMEIVDNAIMWFIPGAMDAGLDSLLFWGSLTFALVAAGLAAWPLNYWLIARGRGHAVVHGHHAQGHAP